MTEYSPYGARHFLRDADPESASELRTRVDPLISGQPLGKGGAADIDQFELAAVLAYRTIVLQRSPTASRPPSPYRLVSEDRWWQVWQRPALVDPPVIAHQPLGNEIAPGSVPSCSSVLALARQPGTATLVAPPVRNPVVVAAATSTHPARWTTGLSYLSLAGAGTASIPVAVPESGRYSVWLGGSIHTPVSIAVDGRHVGSAEHDVQEAAQYRSASATSPCGPARRAAAPLRGAARAGYRRTARRRRAARVAPRRPQRTAAARAGGSSHAPVRAHPGLDRGARDVDRDAMRPVGSPPP